MRKILTIVFVLLALGLTACTSPEDQIRLYEAKRKVAAAKALAEMELVDSLQIEAALKEEIASLPVGPERTRLIAKLQKIQFSTFTIKDSIEKAEFAEKNVDEAIANSNSDIDAAEEVADAVTPWIPGPFGAVVLSGLTAIFGLWRSRRHKVAALEIAKSANPYLKLKEGEAKLIRADQGALARRIVDEAQGKKKGLPL